MRLPAVSVCWIDMPVTLPPGRARLATTPAPTGSICAANTIGISVVACFAASTGADAQVTITSTLSPTNSAAILAVALGMCLRPAVFDRDGTPFDPAEFPQPPYESCQPLACLLRRGSAQKSDGRQLHGLLGMHIQRPYSGAAESCDEFPPPHSITSSARASSAGGTSRPSDKHAASFDNPVGARELRSVEFRGRALWPS